MISGPVLPTFLSGGGEMGQRIREMNWAATPLGPVNTWSQGLRTCISIMLTSRQPIWIGWGKELIKLYNDPYKAIVGGKDAWALGTSASIVWKEIWPDISHLLEKVMEKNEGTYVESQLLIMERNGYPEETYYTFSYTPVLGEDGIPEGMICANSDDTHRIIGERQLQTLTQLGKSLTDSKTNIEVVAKTIAVLKNNPFDFPFAFFYSLNGNTINLSEATHLEEISRLVPHEIDLDDANEVTVALKEAATTDQRLLRENLRQRIGHLPSGAWEVSPDKAIVMPVKLPHSKEMFGFLVLGVNPYRLLDEKYNSFLSLIADQMAISFANVHLLEEERKRAEALAEIDRLKTAFFSNISHEFRTPLTLLLGPLEEALTDTQTLPENKVRLDLAFRNAIRMQKLVNTLLEFSRIEAGRVEGKFSRTDIAALTEDLASTFRSAIEKAGMQLRFRNEGIRDEVYVDVEMWEKIILNLLSNAFKYSNQGAIEVAVAQHGDQVHVSVSDTGIGIPANQLEQIFTRFHRVESAEGRSQEGTGIGLAMVKELVKLHQGTIQVSSEEGRGSTFTISIPTGKAHLPEDKIVEPTKGSAISGNSLAFVEEALKWIPDHIVKPAEEEIVGFTQTAQTVLLADDNADMRDYIFRLLSPYYVVKTVTNGEEAWEFIQDHKPDLIISDVMMPRLDGFALLARIRANAHTKNIPLLFLSARAGEEAKVEGLQAGADDYLVKPFSSRELLARVDANIRIAKNRMEAEANLRNVVKQAPVGMALLRGTSLLVEIANDEALEICGKPAEKLINHPILEALPELAQLGFGDILGKALKGEASVMHEMPVNFEHNMYISFSCEPVKDSKGAIDAIMVVMTDVSEQVSARKQIEQSERELRELADSMPQIVWTARPDGYVDYYNKRWYEFTGLDPGYGDASWIPALHPDDVQLCLDSWYNAVHTGSNYEIEYRFKDRFNGGYRWFLGKAVPVRNNEGVITKWFGSCTDIDDQKQFSEKLEQTVQSRTEELQRSNDDLLQFAHVTSHDLKEPVRKVKTFGLRLQDDFGDQLPEKGRNYLNKIMNATDRMFTMIEGVLAYSSISATTTFITAVDLNEVIRNIQTDLEVLIQQKNGTIRSRKLPVIEGTPVLLYQLFYNIILNSLKFSRQDVPSEINITAYETGAEVRIVISDNGIGFEEQYAQSIFNAFSRLHPKEQFEGTGLGLALCRKIVERHNGSISAHGVKNQGAAFTIILPLRIAETADKLTTE